MPNPFLLAIERTEFRSFGLRLVPLTVGHLFALRRAESPFIDRHTTPDNQDFLTAAFLCSGDPESAETSLTSVWFPLFCVWWRLRVRRLNIAVEQAVFVRYLNRSIASPSTHPTHGGKTSTLHSPIEWRLAAFLVGQCCMSWNQAMQMRVADVNCLIAAHGERVGEVHVEDSDAHDALMEMVRSKEAEARN